MKHAVLLTIALTLSQALMAREEVVDTLFAPSEVPPAGVFMPGNALPNPTGVATTPFYEAPGGFVPSRPASYSLPPISPGTIAVWTGGYAGAYMGRESLPGLGGVESGMLAVRQTAGNFTAELYGSAVKYGYYRGLQTSWGFGGSLSYRFSDRLSLTMFGSYYTKTRPMPPAMAGYVNVPRFGGYADITLSDRWGVEVGAQTYHSLSSSHWEVVPIVKPYYRINKKATIGIDVGGIVYELLKSARGYSPGNPTIGPPIGH